MLKHQGASIRTLNFGQCTGNWRKADLAKLTIEGLTTLGIGELGTGTDGPWELELLARNYQKLRHLRLGNDEYLATDYAVEGVLDPDEVGRFQYTENAAELMKVKVAALNEPSTPHLRLESLSLTGLDLNAFARGFFEPVIDFKSLSVLTLESCTCLETALPLLVGKGTGKRKAKNSLRLHTLAIRHENTTDRFVPELEAFLISLKPLAHLHVLLEGNYQEDLDTDKVLQVHGECLRSFVWDERAGPRNAVQDNPFFYPADHEHLKLIAKYCPGLKALGISLEWDIIGSEKSHKEVKWFLICMFVSLLISHRLLLHSLD